MFQFFKKKSPIQKLEAEYQRLMLESYELSKVNRTQSDQKAFEAQEVLKQIDEIRMAKE